jgi:hypothetical protein
MGHYLKLGPWSAFDNSSRRFTSHGQFVNFGFLGTPSKIIETGKFHLVVVFEEARKLALPKVRKYASFLNSFLAGQNLRAEM